MADIQSRVVAALNFLTGEGVSFYPDGCDHSAMEALINNYFDSPNGNDDSSDDSDHNEGASMKLISMQCNELEM